MHRHCISVAALCLKNPWQPLRPLDQWGKKRKPFRPAPSLASKKAPRVQIKYRGLSNYLVMVFQTPFGWASRRKIGDDGLKCFLDNMATRRSPYLYNTARWVGLHQSVWPMTFEKFLSLKDLTQSYVHAPNKAGYSTYTATPLVQISSEGHTHVWTRLVNELTFLVSRFIIGRWCCHSLNTSP